MKKHLHKRAISFRYAFKGLYWVLSTQPNMLIHLVAAVGVIGAGFYFSITRLEWIAVIFAIGMVWMAEAFNTALEFLTDLVSPEYHPLAGKVKDIAAAAVLIAAIAALITGLIVFIPYLVQN